jgi:hypothetical protein
VEWWSDGSIGVVEGWSDGRRRGMGAVGLRSSVEGWDDGEKNKNRGYQHVRQTPVALRYRG